MSAPLEIHSYRRPSRGTARLRRILLAGGLAGVLDLAAAIVQGAIRGTAPERILQSIASGILGRDAFDGGGMTVLLGLELHFFIALSAATVYLVAAERWTVLAERWVLWSGVYGVLVWAVMNLVVLPLSAAPFRFQFSVAAVMVAWTIHVVCVGWVIGFVARRSVTAFTTGTQGTQGSGAPR
ncbi:MAG: hypothetical protein IT357_11430 [Gemmatimonadaceae bacterium]|nr:hypothetical protein [Gemmatimonadaceae bacterium]